MTYGIWNVEPVSKYLPDRLLPRQNHVHAAADFAQVSFVAARQFHGQIPAEFDLTDRLADFLPIDAAFAQRYPLARFVLEIFEVEFDDPFAEGANPLLREAVHHDVADVEIGSDPAAIEFVHVFGGVVRGQQELIPDRFDADEHAQLLGQREELSDVRLRALPRLRNGRVGFDHRRD